MVTDNINRTDDCRGKLYGLIGFPLGHSFSRQYFTDKFNRQRESGIVCNNEYRLFPLADINDLFPLLNTYPNLAGLNVTIPYKEKVIPFLDGMSEEASKIGAVNVIRIERDSRGGISRMTGHNSDCYGFRESLLPLLRPDVREALVLGTGGASKAVSYVLKELGMDVTMVSRTPEDSEIGYSDLTEDIMARNHIIVNCTPVGTYPNVSAAPAIPYHMLTSRHICYDLVYNPDVTEFMRLSAEQGAAVKNGLEMLHLQADRAWQIWHE